MDIFKPFQEIGKKQRTLITTTWIVLLFVVWGVTSVTGTTHLFPTIGQVLNGFTDLYKDGLVVHIFSSIWLCTKAVFLSVIISLAFAYCTPIPFMKPLSTFITKLRYLPLTGITFYISILINDARSIQVSILVVFMTTFLITSLLNVIKDIPDEEYWHAKTIGCNRWEIILEVVIKGRLDYVLESVRQNLAIVWMMLVTIESLLAAAGGLGYLIKNNDKMGDGGKVIALQIIIIVFGLILDAGLTKIRRLIFRYSKF